MKGCIYSRILVKVCVLVCAATGSAKYGGGSGTAEDPYRIETPAHLVEIADTPSDWGEWASSTYFILMNDLDMAGISMNPIGIWEEGEPDPFIGCFDGQNHVIENLTIDHPESEHVGLFGSLSGQVRCLGLDNVFLRGESVGGIAGNSSSGVITECFVTGSVTGIVNVGGIVGRCYCVEITDSYSQVTVIASERQSGGITGIFDGNSIIQNCYAAGTVQGTSYVGGLVGRGGYTGSNTVQSCFWDTDVSGVLNSVGGGTGLSTEQMQRMITYSLSGWSGESWTIDDGNDYPHLVWEQAEGLPIAELSLPFQGDGTAENPFLIQTPEDIQTLSLTHMIWDCYFLLENDLNLDGFAINPIGHETAGNSFRGHFDGQGHSISNMTLSYSSDSDYVGLFGYISSAGNVQDLILDSVYVVGGDCIGGLAGMTTGTIMDCRVTGTVAGESRVGGVAGDNRGIIQDCCSEASIIGRQYIGGLVGWNDEPGKIQQSYAKGTISAPAIYDSHQGSAGGLVGINRSDIINSFSSGNVSNYTYGVGYGGLVGRNSKTVSNCYSTCAVTVDSPAGCVGGLCGTNSALVSHCFAAGPVNCDGWAVGGLIGGLASEPVTASFWDIEATGLADSAAGIGLSTAVMYSQQTYLDAGWDFVNIWRIDEDGTYYPHLWWEQLQPVITLSQTEFLFTSSISQPLPQPQTLTISNHGSAVLNWSTNTETLPIWLLMDISSGTVATSQTVDVSISVDVSGMEAGWYEYNLVISDPSARNIPQVARIALSLESNRIFNVPSDYPTIQAAIDAATNNDMIVLAPGTYTGDGNRDIDFKGKAIIVRSTDPQNPDIVEQTVIDCQASQTNPHRGFLFQSGESRNTVLSGVTITGGTLRGEYGAAVYCSDASPTIEYCVMRNNHTLGWHSHNQADLCAGNGKAGYGGALYCQGGAPRIRFCSVYENTVVGENGCDASLSIYASAGGSAYGGGFYCAGAAIVENCIFQDNTVQGGRGGGGRRPYEDLTPGDGFGGGLYATEEVTITQCSFFSNHVTGGRGGEFDSEYDGARGGRGYGGGICLSGCMSTTVTDCLIEGNFTTGGQAGWKARLDDQGDAFGGGICILGSSSVTLDNSLLSSNQATGAVGWVSMGGSGEGGNAFGGGLYINSSQVGVLNCHIQANTTVGGEGGYTMMSDISRGGGDAFGGGLYVGSSVKITNCLLEGNSSVGGKGSGINSYYEPWGSPGNGGSALGGGGYVVSGTMENCTISSSFVIPGTGGIILGENNIILGYGPDGQAACPGLYCESQTNIINSIFWNNHDAEDQPNDIAGSGFVVSYSCTEETAISGTNMIHDDPLFIAGPLGDYYLSQTGSGQAQTSPCVDTGSDTAENLELNTSTTRTDCAADSGVVDMGYHYPICTFTTNKADLNDDGKVDLADFAEFAQQWLWQSECVTP
ncbi:MAG: hypothetical protein JXA82_04505 [Sedimentisphaerales bacterium]|nr:hypothetical protein [Sedimentisphaerales bacterium]